MIRNWLEVARKKTAKERESEKKKEIKQVWEMETYCGLQTNKNK